MTCEMPSKSLLATEALTLFPTTDHAQVPESERR